MNPVLYSENLEILEKLNFAPEMKLEVSTNQSSKIRLIKLDEINEERHQTYRQALANVYSSLDPEQPVRVLYLLDGKPSGISLYFGVIANSSTADLHEAMKGLRGALEGQLPGINFGEEITTEDRDAILARLSASSLKGVMLGAPTQQSDDDSGSDENFQGVDRLIRALQSGSRHSSQSDACWQVAVVSQPMPRIKVRTELESVYQLTSQLAGLVRTSVQASGNNSRQKSASHGTSFSRGSNDGTSYTAGKNEGGSEGKSWGTNSSSGSSGQNSGGNQGKSTGTSTSKTTNNGTSETNGTSDNWSLSDTTGNSLGITQDLSNKHAQHLVDYLDKQLIPRLQKGLTKGLFHHALYFSAENRSTYTRLKNTLRATFQGNQMTMSPLEVYDLTANTHTQLLDFPTDLAQHSSESLCFHGLHKGIDKRISSLVTAEELAIVAGLPQNEVQGIRRRKTVAFAVDLPAQKTENSLDLGTIIDRGRRYPNNRVRLSRQDLNKHVFITGVTGAGKTTTCLNLLIESQLPFLVIEPAKTEYRELATRLNHEIDYYRPNGDNYQSLRINPFALIRKNQRIKSHAGFLKNVFAAVFPMEASMPMMIEAAILASYEAKGWDIDENEFLFDGDPFTPDTQAWPTMSDMIKQLDLLIPTYGLGKEFEEKYRGSLVSRLRSMTDGTLGKILDVHQSIDFQALLERRVVIELEELQSGEEKALLMALLLGGLNEAIRAHHQRNPGFRQLTLIEEAHRLLARPEPGDKAAALAVESFADMLAEVRKYGAGLIIADQIPAKLIPDVIKNTHTKIVHRLFAEDDRRAMGEAMMMDEEQRNFLPNLGIGEAIVFCGGWHGPTHAAIRNDHAQTDNHQAFDLEKCSIRQLWRDKERYFPQTTKLTKFKPLSDQIPLFAEFVVETRQAQNHLLRLCGKESRSVRQVTAFKRLKQWYEKWHPVLQEAQRAYEQWKSQDEHVWPIQLITAAWIAMLLDANPQPHTTEKEVPNLAEEDRKFLCDANTELMKCINDTDQLESFKKEISERSYRDLKAHFEHLQKFKSI